MSLSSSKADDIFEWCGNNLLRRSGPELAHEARRNQMGKTGTLHRGIFSAIYMSPQDVLSKKQIPIQWVPLEAMEFMYNTDKDAISMGVLTRIRSYDPRAGFLLLMMIKMTPSRTISNDDPDAITNVLGVLFESICERKETTRSRDSHMTGDEYKTHICQHHCTACGRTMERPLRCGGCHGVYYCGRDCQRADWKASHRQTCQKIAHGLLQASSEFRRRLHAGNVQPPPPSPPSQLNSFDVSLVVGTNGHMRMMPGGQAARQYVRNNGKGACLMLPVPPGLDFSLGVSLPKDAGQQSNPIVADLMRWCPLLHRQLGRDYLPTGTFVLHVWSPRDKTVSLVRARQHGIAHRADTVEPIRTAAEYFDLVCTVLRSWNCEYASMQEFQENTVLRQRGNTVLPPPPIHVVVGNRPPVLVTHVYRCLVFCHGCGRGGRGVTLTPCHGCAGHVYCSENCRTNHHICNQLDDAYYVDMPSVDIVPGQDIPCSSMDCCQKTTGVCEGPDCAFGICGRPECADNHAAYCTRTCRGVDPTVLRVRYHHARLRKHREMVKEQEDSVEEKEKKKKKKKKNKKKKKKKNSEREIVHDPQNESENVCFLCLDEDVPESVDCLPCNNQHSDGVHNTCWKTYVEFATRGERSLLCPMCHAHLV